MFYRRGILLDWKFFYRRGIILDWKIFYRREIFFYRKYFTGAEYWGKIQRCRKLKKFLLQWQYITVFIIARPVIRKWCTSAWNPTWMVYVLINIRFEESLHNLIDLYKYIIQFMSGYKLRYITFWRQVLW